MTDPFPSLLNSLQSVFHLEAMRNGEYTYPVIRRLKEATELYNPKAKNTFVQLLRAIKEALPHIEKWRVDFKTIRKSMDELAKLHHMPVIDWNTFLSHSKVSSRFQFSALHHSNKEIDLIPWLTSKTGKNFFHMEPNEVTQTLIAKSDRSGFSQKLSAHLKKNPDFLYQLITDSEKNFIKICNSRLIFYLTDQQIAKAIIKHIPAFVHKEAQPFEQVAQLVHTLNEILSNGRSISTLLRNAQAKPILFNSIFFQLYETEGFRNHQQQPKQKDYFKEEKELLKP